jgi:hypothetical protein
MKILLIVTLAFILGCASGVSGMLRFQDRELLVHPDKPALAYPHRVTECTPRTGISRILGKKCVQVQKIDEYDMNDPVVRKSLIDASFTCKSAMRFKY